MTSLNFYSKMSILKAIYMLVIMSLFFRQAVAQRNVLPTEKPVYLADSISNSYYEFSGMAKWKNKILLIPQHRSAYDTYHIIAVDTASIDSVLNGTAFFATKTFKLIFNHSLDTLYNAIKKAIAPRTDFGGIEGAVVVNNNIFFTIETDSVCYVIKGLIDERSMQINFAPNDTLSLPKPDYTFGNAGFESIAYLPQQKKLIAVYENNAVTTAPTAYTFTTNLKNKQAITFTKPLLFRLTDASFFRGNTLLGLNHYYRDYVDTLTCGVVPRGANTLKNEYCYYIGTHLAEAKKEMSANPQQTSFTRIVLLSMLNKKFTWKEKKIISYSADNWEGMVPYKNGVLLVVDGRPPGVPCKLSYFDLR